MFMCQSISTCRIRLRASSSASEPVASCARARCAPAAVMSGASMAVSAILRWSSAPPADAPSEASRSASASEYAPNAASI